MSQVLLFAEFLLDIDSSSSWPCLTFYEPKITDILKSGKWGLGEKKTELTLGTEFLKP